MNGIFTARNLTRSCSKMYTPTTSSKIKKIRLMYHSMLKHFSSLSLPIHWISTPNNLPPSNAGIGSTLNIAKASEIIPANPKYTFRPPDSRIISPNFTAPAGPVIL